VPARILVDLLGFTGSRGGTETYAREIASRLPPHLGEIELVGLTNTRGADLVGGFFPGEVRVVPWVGGDRVSWAAGEVLRADASARRASADLLWCPANFGPVVRGVARVVTIHDVIYHEVPGDARDRASRAVTSWLMTRSARTADRVLTVSQTAASSIVARLGVDHARVHVIHNGSSPPRPVSAPSVTLSHVRDTRPVLLSSGNRMPHKNFEGLLRALATIDPGRRPLAVVTGGSDPDPLRDLAGRLGLSDDVLLPGWVDADELEALYRAADLYVCPSLVEGFGLPIVDAMLRGCPVLANDVAVLREVGGPHARYADATSPARFGAAILDSLGTPRSELETEAARAWAGGFTWDAAAEATAAQLTEAIVLAREQR
jgi:glycosyltransferase involved in cell wall biosynthesis